MKVYEFTNFTINMLHFKTIKKITAPLCEIQTEQRLKLPTAACAYANYSSRLDKASQCRSSKVLRDDDCSQGKDDYSGIQGSHIKRA